MSHLHPLSIWEAINNLIIGLNEAEIRNKTVCTYNPTNHPKLGAYSILQCIRKLYLTVASWTKLEESHQRFQRLPCATRLKSLWQNYLLEY